MIFCISLVRTWPSSVWSEYVIQSKVKCKQCREKSKSHYKASILISKERIICKAICTLSKVLVWLWLGPLATWSIWNILLGVFFSFLAWVGIALLCEDWDKFVLRDATFANRACQCFSRLVKPLINTLPAVKMAALSNNRLFGRFQADVAFEHAFMGIFGYLRLLLRRDFLLFWKIIWFQWLFINVSEVCRSPLSQSIQRTDVLSFFRLICPCTSWRGRSATLIKSLSPYPVQF